MSPFHLDAAELRHLDALAAQRTPEAAAALDARWQVLAQAAGEPPEDALLFDGDVPIAGCATAAFDSVAACEGVLRSAPVDPVLQASACLCLLRRHEYAGFAGAIVEAAMSVDDVEARLAALLVAHPVLMDPRLAFAVGSDLSNRSWDSVARTLAGFASARLPCVAHGLSVDALRAFASHPATQLGLTHAAAPGAAAPGACAKDSPLLLACRAMRPARAGGNVAPFASALLSLSHLAFVETGRCLVRLKQLDRQELPRKLHRRLAAAFWDLAVGGGASRIAASEFAQAVRSTAIEFAFADGRVAVAPAFVAAGDFNGIRVAIAMEAEAFLFGHDERLDDDEQAWCGRDEVRRRALAAFAFMVDCGLAPDRTAAARDLESLLIGDDRLTAKAGPACTVDGATGFLDALRDAGSPTRFAIDPADAAIPWEGDAAVRAKQRADTWLAALAAHRVS